MWEFACSPCVSLRVLQLLPTVQKRVVCGVVLISESKLPIAKTCLRCDPDRMREEDRWMDNLLGLLFYLWGSVGSGRLPIGKLVNQTV